MACTKIYEKVAGLFQSIVQNYAFYNTNKRTDFVGLVTLLRKNAIDFYAEKDDIGFFMVKISDQQNKMSIDEISKWIENHSRRSTKY
ncbi:type II toxin-antitoxin system death-on-curing family toxin [Sporolactobacillus sp. STSJ-5]|uniref:type II toxin-antitoxin system death-on-curing family toxin n=1 Tax=Sporolactobacillus sp. STSJ-5 TaxID=2965076 RepID=UPI00351CE6A3